MFRCLIGELTKMYRFIGKCRIHRLWFDLWVVECLGSGGLPVKPCWPQPGGLVHTYRQLTYCSTIIETCHLLC